MIRPASQNHRKPTESRKAKKQRRLLGQFIVADPNICHGKPTFIGTRIMVWQILKEVARGTSWNRIAKLWGGRVSKDAIAEAVQLAERTFENHADEYAFGEIIEK